MEFETRTRKRNITDLARETLSANGILFNQHTNITLSATGRFYDAAAVDGMTVPLADMRDAMEGVQVVDKWGSQGVITISGTDIVIVSTASGISVRRCAPW